MLRDCIFLSSLEVFLQLFCRFSTLVAEDLLCAPQAYIVEDYAARARDGGVDVGFQPVMDFKSVMPASHMPRIDSMKQQYAAYFARRGLPEPARGRPIWDSGQNATRGVAKHSHAPTMLPRATLWSSLLERPATCEEHALLQGIVLARTDATPWGSLDYVSIVGLWTGVVGSQPRTKQQCNSSFANSFKFHMQA